MISFTSNYYFLNGKIIIYKRENEYIKESQKGYKKYKVPKEKEKNTMKSKI
jgi:hypothetical protein